jgi:SAM-dependent methyltransferase
MTLIRRNLERSIDREIPAGSRACVVDLGCGDRPYEPLFRGRAERYIGIDVAGNPQADLTVRPGEPVPLPDGTADVVLSSQVLEHVADVDFYLSECRRLLKPRGILLLSTHGSWVYHPYPTDVRRWTCWGLKYEIERFGFAVIEQSGCMGPLAYTSQVRLQLIRGLLDRLGWIAAPFVGLLSAVTQVGMILEDSITPERIRFENSAVYVVEARPVIRATQ